MKNLFEKLIDIKPIKALRKIGIVNKLLTWEIFSYLLFGVLTTAVSFVSYFIVDKIHFAATDTELTDNLLFVIGTDKFSWDLTMAVVANIISWVAAVLFAFFTNKAFVFESKSWAAKTVFKELSGFVSGRILTLVLFEILLFGLLAKFINDYIAKILISVFVIIFNYIFSKLLVFKKEKK
ncbi:MAG TPA: GtrA family protein [Clostridiales bacterium]|nr:GtrA family protein [Clostridiales bacterium]